MADYGGNTFGGRTFGGNRFGDATFGRSAVPQDEAPPPAPASEAPPEPQDVSLSKGGNIEKIKRNLGKMIDQGAPKEHLDSYLASEGFKSPEEFRAAVRAPVTGDALARSFSQGSTFGFGDELAAGVRAGAPKLSNWMMSGPALQRDESIGGSPTPQTVSEAPTVQGRYDEELGKEREKLKDFSTAHPNVDLGAKLAGGVATTLLTGRAAPSLFAPVAGAGPVSAIAGNMLKAGAVGGGLGALAGYGAGEGVEGRTQNALTGGVFGAGVGAAAPVAGAVGRAALETAPGRFVSEKIVSPAVRSFANAFSPSGAPAKSLSAAADGGGPPSALNALADRTGNVAQEAALQRLATAIQRSGQSPQYWQQQIDKRGAEAVLADLDPQFLNMAVGVKTLPGDTKSLAENVLKPRDRGTGQRLVGAAEGTEPPPSDYALRGEGQAFDQNARAVGAEAYGAMKEAGLKQTPELMALYENPAIKTAMDNVLAAVKTAKEGRPNAGPTSPVEIMHMVKQEIDGLGFDKMSGRPLSTQQQWRDLSTAFVREFKRANPAAAEADAKYRVAKSLPEYYDAGAALLTKGMGEKARETSGPALGDLIGKSVDANQPLAARAGATNALRDATQTLTGARSVARVIDQSGPIRDKLVQLYGPAHADRIMQQAETEGVFANTSNRLLGGPHTADDLVNAADVGGNLGLRMSNKSLSVRALEHLSDIVNRVVNPNEVVRNSLGRTLINTDTSENQRALRRAGEILLSRQRGNSLPASLSSVGPPSGRE